MNYILFFFLIILTSNALGYPSGQHEQNAIDHWLERGTDMQSAKSHYNRALLFYYLFELELALEHINYACAIEPQNNSILNLKGLLLQRLGKFSQAIPIYEQLLLTNYNKKNNLHGLHCCLQALGNLPKSSVTDQALRKFNGVTNLETPIDPTVIKNRSVLIIGERALGDQIQYLRFAISFREMGANSIYYAVDEKLVPLLSQCPYVDKVLPLNKKPYPPTDLQFMQDQLIFLLNIDLNTLPKPTSYITADENLQKQWNQQLSTAPGLKIGICWQAKQGLLHELFPHCNRCMPLSQFQKLSTLPNIHLYSLQKGIGENQINNISFPLELLPANFDQDNGAFMDTAAFMKNLDLVITVDTSIAHLAGALGIPVWVLLPYTADTRWMIDRTDTPWYPTMRLFRQSTPGNWEEVIKEVRKKLINLQSI